MRQTSHVDFRFHIKTKSGEENGQRFIEGFASTDDLDRDDEIITKEALEKAATDLISSSTVFYEHKHSEFPVGRVVAAKAVNGKLYIKVYISTTATKVWTLIQEGILNHFSIGGKVVEFSDEFVEEFGKKITKILEIKLYEVSVVGLPSNPNALITNVSKAIFKALHVNDKNLSEKEAETMSKEKEKKVEENKEEKVIEKKDEIIEKASEKKEESTTEKNEQKDEAKLKKDAEAEAEKKEEVSKEVEKKEEAPKETEKKEVVEEIKKDEEVSADELEALIEDVKNDDLNEKAVEDDIRSILSGQAEILSGIAEIKAALEVEAPAEVVEENAEEKKVEEKIEEKKEKKVEEKKEEVKEKKEEKKEVVVRKGLVDVEKEAPIEQLLEGKSAKEILNDEELVKKLDADTLKSVKQAYKLGRFLK